MNVRSHTVGSSQRFGAIAILRKVLDVAGEIEGRVRLQKTLYLLQCLGVKELARVSFRYHHYGPYSALVAGALQQAVASGIILEDTSNPDDEWQRYSYRPGENCDYPEVSNDSAKTIADTVAVTKGAQWRVLELAATAQFLARDKGISDTEGMEEALALKPHCHPFREDADAILAGLGLLPCPGLLLPATADATRRRTIREARLRALGFEEPSISPGTLLLR